MPYFDPNVGPFTQDENGEWHGQGEIRLLDLTRSRWVGSRPSISRIRRSGSSNAPS
jgi:hypothetical protein